MTATGESSRKKKQLTESELALRREETARKRRNLTEKKLEDEKVRRSYFGILFVTPYDVQLHHCRQRLSTAFLKSSPSLRPNAARSPPQRPAHQKVSVRSSKRRRRSSYRLLGGGYPAHDLWQIRLLRHKRMLLRARCTSH